jgi:hypothetical protein
MALAACVPVGERAPGAAATGSEPRWSPVAGWPQVPADLGPTHGGLAFDRAGRLWVGTDGPHGVVAFAPDGTLVAELPELSGSHALLLRDEGGEELLYVAHLRAHRVVKVRLDGEQLWELGAPLESGACASADQFQPTAVAVGPDGRLFVADGYGTSLIHLFDAQRRWVKSFAGPGSGDGQCNTPHGLALDERFGAPRLLVCDRENRRLLHFDLDGRFLGVHAADLRRPCAVGFLGPLLAVAELEGRVSVLRPDATLLVTLGDNPQPDQRANFEVPPAEWSPGVLCAPHATAFDARGDLYVLDWNRSGRLTRFARAP